MTDPQAALIALGSNLGDRLMHLRAALSALEVAGCEVVARSGVYRTAPMYVLEQPEFYNACVLIRTTLEPHALLALMLETEAQLGRRRDVDKGPRVIDLDLLSYEDAVIRDVLLEIPHPGMAERHFVLAPLMEVAPIMWRHPTLDLSASDLLKLCIKDPMLTRLDVVL
jgi:2-amino-4-hydroxy-6-hydroxymethyldihydropteridine diphosphokinase